MSATRESRCSQSHTDRLRVRVPAGTPCQPGMRGGLRADTSAIGERLSIDPSSGSSGDRSNASAARLRDTVAGAKRRSVLPVAASDSERVALTAFVTYAVLAGGNAVRIRFSNRELAPWCSASLRLPFWLTWNRTSPRAGYR